MKKSPLIVSLFILVFSSFSNANESDSIITLSNYSTDKEGKKFRAEIFIDENVEINKEIELIIKLKPLLICDTINCKLITSPGIKISEGNPEWTIIGNEGDQEYEFKFKLIFQNEGLNEVKVEILGTVQKRIYREIENTIVNSNGDINQSSSYLKIIEKDGKKYGVIEQKIYVIEGEENPPVSQDQINKPQERNTHIGKRKTENTDLNNTDSDDYRKGASKIASTYNLKPYTRPEWSHPLVLTKNASSKTNKSSFTTDDTIYASWAVINNGSSNIYSWFYTYLYIDDFYITEWDTSGLDSGIYWYVDWYSIGKLSVGYHTVKIVCDPNNTILELYEDDNEYSQDITVPSITLNSPIGGEKLIAGTQYDITWTSDCVDSVMIEYFNGSEFEAITESTPSDGLYTWTLPENIKTSSWVRITDTLNSSLSDMSSMFIIVVASITVTSPQKGEILIAGTQYYITWTREEVSNVKIEFSSDGGSSWTTIISSTLSDGSFSWTVPGNSSYFCRVKITDTENSTISGMSDNFTISVQPLITIMSPIGGENWIAGSQYDITWTSEYVENVKIEYSLNSGSSWSIITSSTSSDSSYTWTVPKIESTSTGCRVRITDTSDSSVSDVSNDFTILVFSIVITSPNGGENWKAGSSHNITWTSENVENVKIEYSFNSGSSWSIITSSTSSDGSYTWTVPKIASTSTGCRVRITDISDSSVLDTSNNDFTILVFSIVITRPNGGENWTAGSSHNITWTSENVENVKIEYSLNSGSSWSIITSSTSSDGSYTWTVPKIASTSTGCRVRITDTSDSSVSDVSNNDFTIGVPLIVVKSPNGGEKWTAGVQYEITWTSEYVENVKIEYSLNSGSSWSIITSSTSSDGSYTWTVPKIASTSTGCRVRITDTSDSSVSDVSNDFTILVFSIVITRPNGGENWKAGSSHNITWTSENVENVKIEYSFNSGSSWSIITSSTSSDGSYTWTVPKIASTSTGCRVRITDISDSSVLDTSNNDFTILVFSIVITRPNGGENWTAGSSHNITWTSENVENVKIEYSLNSGSSWSIITSSTSSDGSYTWTVPKIASTSTGCRVRITDTSDSSVSDVSNNDFTISIQPLITIMSPKGGENWTAGSQYDITWTSEYVENVKIEYSLNSGSSWSIITSSTSSDGSYTWTVPKIASTSTGCRVRITDISDSSVLDTSNNDFTIWVFSIVITRPNGGENWKAGLQYDITWTSENVENVKIEYSLNSGSSWSIITSSTSSDGSYTWTVPKIASTSTDCRVRITDISDSSVLDTSNNDFTIGVPLIVVKSPNGGEKWTAGVQYEITWTSEYVENVKIDYSLNSGSSWSIITSSTSSDGSYSWTVPKIASTSTDCRVRITDISDSSVLDMSNNDFTIGVPLIVVKSPNGGEKWTAGVQYEITWTSEYVENVKIDYSLNSGSSWSIITSSTSSDGSYSWTVPKIASTSTGCRVRIISTSDSSVSDVSNNDFTILVFSIVVTYPKGGEKWTAGAQYEITWTSENVNNVKIEFSSDGGSSWTTIISNTSSNGLYTWTVQKISSTNCYVRITDISKSNVTARNNSNFTIVIPWITVISPNGGEEWIVKTDHTISWTSENVSAIKIEYSLDNGSQWMTFMESIDASLGSYNWELPESSSTSCLIRISDVSNQIATDICDSIFTIRGNSPPSVMIYPIEEEYSGNIGFTIEAIDADNDSVYISIECIVDGTPFQLSFNLSKIPSGEKIPIIWSSFNDLGFVYKKEVCIHITPWDTDPGLPVLSDPFIVTNLIGDYNYNLVIDGADLKFFTDAWYDQDITKEIGPVSGEPPYLEVNPDNKLDFEDLMVFAWMWQWYTDYGKLKKIPDINTAKPVSEKSSICDDIYIIPEENGVCALVSDKKPNFLNLLIEIDGDNNGEITVSGGEYWQSDGKGIVLSRTYDDGTIEMAAAYLGDYTKISTNGRYTLAKLCINNNKNIEKIMINYKMRLNGEQDLKTGTAAVSGDIFYKKPEEFTLLQNKPNPFNPVTLIEYTLPKETHVRLVLYNISGQKVALLKNRVENAGRYIVTWEATDLPSGVYFYRLETGEFVETKKMLLLK